MKHTLTLLAALLLAPLGTLTFGAGPKTSPVQSLDGDDWRTALLLAPMGTFASGGVAPATSTVQLLDGPDWLIAPDPENVGREEKWFETPRPDAKAAMVPKISQFALPGYHGVMWYWRNASLPARAEPLDRYLLRFGAVFYKTDVYVNGQRVGGHEGGESPFTIDITEAARPGRENLIAVRVLDPTPKAIDGIDSQPGATPHLRRQIHPDTRRDHRFGRTVGAPGGLCLGALGASRLEDGPR